MATTVVMVVSSPHRPKLAPKPSPAKQLDAVSHAPQPPLLRSPLSRPEFFGPRETQNVVPASDDNKRPDSVHHHRCVNQTSTCGECRNADPSPVNIDSVILRRGRRTKAPKPLPYLEPIVTYLARSDRQSAINGRTGVTQQRRRKRVTFAPPSSARSLKSRQHRVGRTHSEKLSLGRRRELAYLVVDLLQSGSITSCSDEQSESTTQSLRGGASLQRSVTVSDPHARERAMSTGADGSRPVPLPRRIRKVASPAEKDCTTPEHLPSNEKREKSVTSPVPLPRSPARKPTPEREESPPSPQTPSTADSSRSSRSGSIVFQRKMTFEGKETSPRPRSLSTTTQSDSKPPPPPPPRTSSILTHSVPQSKPVVSDSQPSPPSTPPTLPPKSPPHAPPSDPDSAPPPPPLPAKSELSRRIQSSIRQRRGPPTPPQPYETPDPLKLTESLETGDNYSYGATILSDGSSGGYEVSDPNVDMEKDNPEDMYIDPTQSTSDPAVNMEEDKPEDIYIDPTQSTSDPAVNMEEDKPEDIYIDPTQSKQFSSTGKPRPPRPPPPSSSAVRKAQRRKAQTLATSAVALRSRQLTKQRSCSAAQNTSTSQQQKSENPLGSSRSTSTYSKPAEDADEILYEELDIGNSAAQASILWRPPSATNSSQSVVAPSRGDPVGATTAPIPSLPPRAQKPTMAHRVHRSNDQGTKNSTPGKVEHSKSIGDLNTARSSRQVSPCVSSKQDNSDDLELDSADEYEPLDESVPVAPQRTKKQIKGTVISPNRAPGNIYNPNSPQSGKRTPRRPAPVAPPLRKRGEQRNKSPQTIKSSIGSRKSTGGGGKGSPGKQSCQNLEDEGGVEEYVDMDYKSVADGEDGRDVYVDMQPNNKIADTQEDDDDVSLRPYVRT